MTIATISDWSDSLCKALLRGESQTWPHAATAAMAEHFVERVSFHGVECLVYEHLHQLGACPAAVRAALQQLASQRAVWELRNRQQMRVVYAALTHAGIEALVYKGTALAYWLYANPVWRPRADSDLLVAPEQLQSALAVLEGLGYRRYTEADEMIFYKMYFSITAPEGGEHSIDLHWKLNNSELLSALFSFAELRARAIALPALAPEALTVSPVAALIIACLHRGVHKLSAYTVNHKTYYSGDRLIWLQDIDLLVRRLQATDIDTFLACVSAKGLAGICRESIALAASWLHTPLPPGLQEGLAAITSGRPDRYLTGGPFRRFWLDLLACPGWQGKAVYCRHILFPPASYMRNTYAAGSTLWLPCLYLWRIGAGVLQRIRLGMGRP